jgi:RmlD substrate binding domain
VSAECRGRAWIAFPARRRRRQKLARGSILDVAVNIRRGSPDYGPAGPYCEDDEVNPLGIYSNSKPAGGRPVCESVATHMILRTAWIYGAHGQNLVKAI